jgi:hypothetical protein
MLKVFTLPDGFEAPVFNWEDIEKYQKDMIDIVPKERIKNFLPENFEKRKNKNPNHYMAPEILLSIVNYSREFCINP